MYIPSFFPCKHVVIYVVDIRHTLPSNWQTGKAPWFVCSAVPQPWTYHLLQESFGRALGVHFGGEHSLKGAPTLKQQERLGNSVLCSFLALWEWSLSMSVDQFSLNLTCEKIERNIYRARQKKASARFGEFCYCCFLPLLPELACSIHLTWKKPFSRPLYL